MKESGGVGVDLGSVETVGDSLGTQSSSRMEAVPLTGGRQEGPGGNLEVYHVEDGSTGLNDT